jgi:predicted nucleic acid-binding protein
LTAAFLDSSYLIAASFDPSAGEHLSRALSRYRPIYATELLAAECLAFAMRERIDGAEFDRAFARISWVLPDRSLRAEFDRVLAAGYLRGADLWHLACACYLAPNPAELAFLSRDQQQAMVAKRLGFRAR